MADIRNSKKVRQLAAEVRELCALQGVVLVAGEAEELIAARVTALAADLGITHRTFLDSYLQPTILIPAIAAAVIQANSMRRAAAEAVEPVTLDAKAVGRVIASLGMVMKLAVDQAQVPAKMTAALGVATDGSDAIVGIGVALHQAQPQQILTVGGPTLVYARRVLNRAIELIGEGTWKCPCQEHHDATGRCRLQHSLAADLGALGGWAAGMTEPPPTD